MTTQTSETLSKRQVLTKKAAKVATYYKPSTWKEKGLWWTAGLFLITYLIVVIILGFYWSRSPGVYDVREQALSLVNHDESKLVTGTATTATAIRIGETLLERLGSLAQRLSYAVGQAPLATALAGDPSAVQSTPVPTQTQTKTPWLTIDDIFLEARGYTWALLEILQAMEIDFASVLKDKNAVVSLEQITRELKNTQNFIWSPVILNGTGYGPMANHSLVSASYISRVNAAITDLRSLLQKG
ncbi:MAG: DUF2333 family protein [Thiohalocapsa sp.]